MASDPAESVNIFNDISDREELVEGIEKFLQESREYSKAIRLNEEKREFSPELKQQIKDLGYIE